MNISFNTLYRTPEGKLVKVVQYPAPDYGADDARCDDGWVRPATDLIPATTGNTTGAEFTERAKQELKWEAGERFNREFNEWLDRRGGIAP